MIESIEMCLLRSIIVLWR